MWRGGGGAAGDIEGIKADSDTPILQPLQSVPTLLNSSGSMCLGSGMVQSMKCFPGIHGQASPQPGCWVWFGVWSVRAGCFDVEVVWERVLVDQLVGWLVGWLTGVASACVDWV